MIVNHTFSNTSEQMDKPAKPLSIKEHDILSYIGGSIISKLRRRYRSKRQENCEHCLRCLCTSKPSFDADIQPSLTEVLDRGGLTYLVSSALPIFTDLEETFRDFFKRNVGILSFENYNSQISDLATFTFFEITGEYSIPDQVKRDIFKDIVKLFFKIRCASQLHKIVRAFRAKKHVPRKQKALRPSLKK